MNLVATPHVGIVHQVVVQQGKVVIRFQSDSLSHNALRIVLVKVIGQQCQHRAYALAANREHILDRLIQRIGLTVIYQTVQRLIHFLQ